MPPKKKPSPNKPPMRKRRANTMLEGPNKEDSFSGAVKPAVDVPATPAPKAPSLKLVMTSHKTATPSMRLNGPKPPPVRLSAPKPPVRVRQRPDPTPDSLRDLLEPSSPLPSQLSLDSMALPEFPASKRRLPAPGQLTFNQMLDAGRSESPFSFRSSQSTFTARMRASVESQTDSQVTYDDEEDREEREGKRRQKEAVTREEEAATELQNSQRSSQQKKGKEGQRTS